MLTISPAFLEQLHLQVGATVGLAVDHDCLVVNSSPRPFHTLAWCLAAPDRVSRSGGGYE